MTASRVRGRLEKIFAYAINENLFIGNNPASWKGNLDLFLPPANKCNSTQHFKSLSFTELKAIIPKLRQESSIGAKALLFGVLTATRTVEFTQAHWREISWKEKFGFASIASKRRQRISVQSSAISASHLIIKGN